MLVAKQEPRNMAITFDTLEYVNELKAADVPDAQAQAQAKAMRRVLDAALAEHAADAATKGDIALVRKDMAAEFALVRKDMEAMENRITIRLGTMLVVAVGILLAVLPMLIAK